MSDDNVIRGLFAAPVDPQKLDTDIRIGSQPLADGTYAVYRIKFLPDGRVYSSKIIRTAASYEAALDWAAILYGALAATRKNVEDGPEPPEAA